MLDTLASLDREIDALKGGWVPSDTIFLDDWDSLADLLPGDYAEDRIGRICQRELGSSPPDGSTAKKPGTGRAPRDKCPLATFSDDQIKELAEAIKRADCPPFPKLKPTLEIRKVDAKALGLIMSHVVAWVNPHPLGIKRTGNNKPPLCKDLEPAFRDVKKGAGTEEITQMSIQLERDVLQHVLGLPQELQRLDVRQLNKFPKEEDDDTDRDKYNSRFECGDLWRGALDIVRRSLGSGVRAEWAPDKNKDDREDKGEMGDKEADGGFRRNASKGVLTLADHILNIREIREYPWARERAPRSRLKHMLGQTIQTWLVNEKGSAKSLSQPVAPTEDQQNNSDRSKKTGRKGARKDSEPTSSHISQESTPAIIARPPRQSGSRVNHATECVIASPINEGNESDGVLVVQSPKPAAISSREAHSSNTVTSKAVKKIAAKPPRWLTDGGPVAR